MVQSYTGPVRVYKHPFELVIKAYEKRFPTCPQISIFVDSVITSEFKSDDNAIEIIERRCKLDVAAPRYIKKIASVDFVYFIQKNSLDLRERVLNIEARNETFCSRLGIKEFCRYSVHPENPLWTCFEQSASLEVKNFWGFEGIVERLARKQYAANIQKGKEILLEFIEQLISDGVTNVPQWSEVAVPVDPGSCSKDGHGQCLERASSTSLDELNRRESLSSCELPFGTPPEFDNKLSDVYINSYLGELNPLQESRLIELRQRVTELQRENVPSDRTILRFLRARDFNFEKSREMLNLSLTWRKQHRVDHLLQTWTSPEKFESFVYGEWTGDDIDGRPIYTLRFGATDIKGILRVFGEEVVFRYVLKILESGLMKCEENTKVFGKPVTTWTCILDLEGLSMRHLWRPGVRSMNKLIDIVEANYPETMGCMHIVRAPRLFPVVWTLISKFIDENTRKKFIIYSLSDTLIGQSGLTDHIEIDRIPDFLGGTYPSIIPSEASIIPKSMYRVQDDSDDDTQLTGYSMYIIVTLSKQLRIHEVILVISDVESLLTWDFDVIRGDVTFTILHVAELLQETSPLVPNTHISGAASTNALGKAVQTVVESNLCRDGSSVQGSHICRKVGSFILQWKFCGDAPLLNYAEIHDKSKICIFYDVIPASEYRGSMSSLASSSVSESFRNMKNLRISPPLSN